MTDLNLPADYAERILGCDLFTTMIEKFAYKLKLDFDHKIELTVLYDIIARQYLNALGEKTYNIDLIPLFYLQIEGIRCDLDLISENKISSFPLTVKPQYVKEYYAVEIQILTRCLTALPKFIRYYRESYFSNDDTKLIAFLESFVLEKKPSWLAAFGMIIDNYDISKRDMSMNNTLDIGEMLYIVRPYFIHTDRTWKAKKVSIFSPQTKGLSKTYHFDIFSVRVTEKYRTRDNRVILTAETKDKQWLFMSDIKFSIGNKYIASEWYMCYGDGKVRTHKREYAPFYSLEDISAVNKIKGRKLNSFQMKCLLTDLDMALLNTL